MRADVKYYLGKAVKDVNAKGKGAVKREANRINFLRTSGLDSLKAVKSDRDSWMRVSKAIKAEGSLPPGNMAESHKAIVHNFLRSRTFKQGPATLDEQNSAFAAGTSLLNRKSLNPFKKIER